MIHSPADVKKLGAIVSVWAHPDDETFLAAGILASAVQNGQEVVCITATRGEAGSQDTDKWPLATLGQVRSAELAKALKILGIRQHYWLDYRDGCCNQIAAQVVLPELRRLIEKHQPQTILTFGSDGWTGHPDHCTVSAWIAEVSPSLTYKPAVYHAVCTPQNYERYLKEADKHLGIFFNIDKPPLKEATACDICLQLSPELQALKHQALAAMPSQTNTMLQAFSQDFLGKALGIEAFVKVL